MEILTAMWQILQGIQGNSHTQQCVISVLFKGFIFGHFKRHFECQLPQFKYGDCHYNFTASCKKVKARVPDKTNQ